MTCWSACMVSADSVDTSVDVLLSQFVTHVHVLLVGLSYGYDLAHLKKNILPGFDKDWCRYPYKTQYFYLPGCFVS